MSREIFAHHAHVFPPSVFPEGTVDDLLHVMDDCGIARCVAFAPFSRYVGDMDANAWLAKAIQSEDRLTGFGVINMDRDDMEAQVDRISELGLRGIKMHPAFQRFSLMNEKARRVYARAEASGLFISFHTGIHWHRISEYNMLLFDEVAFHYPALRFSLEHAGGYCFFNDAVAVLLNNAAQQPRVYAGMTSVCDRDMNRFWYLSDQQILDLIWLVGDDRLIFGLDFPYNDRQKIAQAIRRFEGMDLSEETKGKLFGGNIARILNA